MFKLLVKKLDRSAKIPVKMPDSAAYDLYSNEDVTIPPGGRRLVGTGVAMSFNRGYVGRICDRSGIAWGNGLHVLAGVIEPEYRGEWRVVFYNTSSIHIRVCKESRIAQVLFYEVADGPVQEVDELSNTVRGTGGFGSTGDN